MDNNVKSHQEVHQNLQGCTTLVAVLAEITHQGNLCPKGFETGLKRNMCPTSPLEYSLEYVRQNQLSCLTFYLGFGMQSIDQPHQKQKRDNGNLKMLLKFIACVSVSSFPGGHT